MLKKLYVLIIVLLVGINVQAEKTAYAYYSNYTLTFRYGEIPDNSVQTWDVSDTGENKPGWASSYDVLYNIRTVVFHESFAEARPKSCYAWFCDCKFLTGFLGLEYLNTSEVTSMKGMFSGCMNLNSLDISMLDTSNLTDVEGMFTHCTNLKTINISNMNLSKVTSLEFMFYGCTWLKQVEMNNFNTSNITNMYSMFHGCENMVTLDLSSFNTANVTNMGGLFSGCKKLTTIYASNEWSNENVINSQYTFYECYNLVGGNGTKYSEHYQSAYYARIDRGPDAPGYFTNKSSHFLNGHEFVDLGLPSGKLWAKTNYGANSEGDYGIYMNWQSRSLVQSVWGEEWSTPTHNDIMELYTQCSFTWEYNSNSVYGCRVTGPNGNSFFLPAAGFKIQGTPQMVGTNIYYWSDNEYEPGFAYALQGSTDNGISVYQTWNTDYAMFPIRPVVSNNSLQAYAALSDNNTVLTFYYDTKKLARKGMSVGPIAYDEVHYKPLSEWYDYSSLIKKVVFDDSFANCHDITSTAYWFESFSNLEEIIGLNKLNTENVTDMKHMFIWCSSLTSLDLSNFNTANVIDMSHMFQQCSSLRELYLETFNTENVVNMHQMFHGCSSVTSLDLSNFNTRNVTDIGFMFYQCGELETLDLSNFNTENVTDMSAFHDCSKLKTIYVNHDWDIGKVEETAFVFYNCYSLEGGQGTKWRDGEIWPIYARIDRGPSAPGYFTKKTSQFINGHEYVDLGLSSGKLWAKTNYGANSEGDYGIYMNWQSRSLVQSVWGEEWSTPSHSDISELYSQCSFTWEYNANSVYGCRVTGPNGNSIFLPAAGFKIQGTPQMVGTNIYYWSDNEYEPGFAYALEGSADNGISIYQTWNVDYAMFPIRPVANGDGSSGEEDETHDFVDLALPSGLLWATTNVGANRPEDIGSYFAWGETTPKSEYSWATYKYANGSETTLTKYCNDSSCGNVDYKSELEEQDDAATANWGGSWRTPRLSETQELINYCSWTLTTQNGVSGYKVTGANGNSIFLPASGVMQYNWSYFTERSVVMSASLFTYCSSASVLNCQDGAPHWWYGWSRCWGYPVRPVTSRDPSGIVNPSEDESHEIIGIYDLKGHKLDGLGKGINIIKYKNGSSKKVVR